MAGETTRTCIFRAKIEKYYDFFKFEYKIALNGYLDKIIIWISLHLPKEA